MILLLMNIRRIHAPLSLHLLSDRYRSFGTVLLAVSAGLHIIHSEKANQFSVHLGL